VQQGLEYGECSRGWSAVSAAGARVLTVDSTTHLIHKWYRQEDDRECSAATLITECNMPLTVSRTSRCTEYCEHRAASEYWNCGLKQ